MLIYWNTLQFYIEKHYSKNVKNLQNVCSSLIWQTLTLWCSFICSHVVDVFPHKQLVPLTFPAFWCLCYWNQFHNDFVSLKTKFNVLPLFMRWMQIPTLCFNKDFPPCANFFGKQSASISVVCAADIFLIFLLLYSKLSNYSRLPQQDTDRVLWKNTCHGESCVMPQSDGSH